MILSFTAAAALPPLYHYELGHFDRPPITEGMKVDAIVIFDGNQERIKHGIDLYNQEYSHRIIISGNNHIIPVGATYPKAMEYDPYATSTLENGIYSAEWILNNQFNKVVLVTSANHMARSYLELKINLPKNFSVFVSQTEPYLEETPWFDREITRTICRTYESYVQRFMNVNFCYEGRDIARSLAI